MINRSTGQQLSDDDVIDLEDAIARSYREPLPWDKDYAAKRAAWVAQGPVTPSTTPIVWGYWEERPRYTTEDSYD